MKRFHSRTINFLLCLVLIGLCLPIAQAQPWAVTDAPIIELEQKYEPRQGDVRVRIRPDRKVLATAGTFSQIQLWDLKTGAKLQTRDLPWVDDFAYTSDGRLIAASWEREKERIRVWEVMTDKELFTVSWRMPSETSFPRPVRSVTGSSFHLSANGVWLAAITFYVFEPRDGKRASGLDIYALERWTIFKAWNLETGHPLTLPTEWKGIDAFAFSHDGKLLASGRPLTLPTEWKGIDAFAFSHDGKLLALGFLEGKVEVWDATSGKLIQRLTKHFTKYSGSMPITAVSFSPDGRLLAAVGGSQLFLWEVSSGKLIQTIAGVLARESTVYGPSYRIYGPTLVFSPDGALIATGVAAANYSLSDPSHIVLWHVATGKPYKILPGEADSVAFSPDGKLVVTGRGGKERGIERNRKVVKTWKGEGTVRIWVR